MAEPSIEQVYQKKTQLEHILIRPDTYIGSVEMTTSLLWVLAENEEHFEQRQIEFVPGLYKIFDEIIVNAADNYQRDKSMDTIKVTIDEEQNLISVWNNGKGIPIEIHKEYKIFVPELIFGHLLSGSNYDDTQKKVVGGRNGYGAKLTNIFSKKFIVECGDSKTHKLFTKTWRHNMSTSNNAEVIFYSGSDFTCISWEADLARFGMTSMTKDIIALLKKRVFDLAGIFNSRVKVYLNKKAIKVPNFSKYVDFYLTNPDDTPKIFDKDMDNERWEVVVSLSDGQFQQVSFVNSICTVRGGTHVDHITNQLVSKLSEAILKKSKKIQIKSHQIKSNLWVFVNCLVENPTFDSQTKETLTLKPSLFGSTCQLSDKYIQGLLKTEIVQSIIQQAEAREKAKLAKGLTGTKKSRLLGIPKLDDANDAGTRNASTCTLILTEGDSAKSLAMAGVEVIGRDKYGVFPLKGKLLNVREATAKQILDNEEIQNLIKILGLQGDKKYKDVDSLRYGKLMIMADQDTDGSHIKGLVINFIHNFWPELVHINGFMKEFITPLLKATKGSEVKSFFTTNDFKQWAQTQNLKEWKIKYYKGLGTSTDKEAQEYFNNLYLHMLEFQWVDQQDDDAIDLLFNKKRADDRKTWLQSYDPEVFLDHTIKQVRYTDFANKEMMQFSVDNNLRAIPSLCDGLKPGQRKILYSCFKRNLRSELKVAQLSGYVAEHSAYHHGEMSLGQTIVGMAQNFVGSNNINLLLPIGQFGTRNQGGKDHASARYIFTNMNKVTRFLFPEPDDHLYNYLEDDGQLVEPEWYLPILPLVLVNGSDGIGTGWSTNIPCYNPREIVQCIKNKLKGEDFKDLDPWFKGFNGDIIKANKGYTVTGKYEINEDEETIDITELPIQKWTKDYKVFLEELAGSNDKKEAELEDIKEYHSNNRVHFTIKPSNFSKFASDGLEKRLRLQGSLQTTNMVLFDNRGKLKKYSTVKEILDEFFNLRIGFYEKRKDYLISRLKRDLELLSNKCRFIIAVITDEIKVRNVKKKEICTQLLQQGFVQMKDMPKIASTKPQFQEKKPINAQDTTENNDVEVENPEPESLFKEYSYLLSMSIWSLSYEKVEELKKEREKKVDELKIIKETTLETMWINDLDQFLIVLDEYEDEEEQARVNRPQIKGNGMKKKNKPKKKVEKNIEEGDKEKPKKKKLDSDKDEADKEKPKKKKLDSAKKPAKDKENINVKEKTSAAQKSNLKQSLISFGKKEEKNDIQSKPTTKIPTLAERVADKMQSQNASTSFQQAYENFQKNVNEEGDKKRKANGELEGKKITRKKFVMISDEEDTESFEIQKENILESSNKGSAVKLRNKERKNYVLDDDEEEEEKDDSGSVFEV